MGHFAGEVGGRLRVLFARTARRLGVAETSFLVPMAVLIGVVTATAAVGFHELILLIRNLLFGQVSPGFLYGPGLWLLVLIPAAGGLVVGVVTRLISGRREAQGVVDVIESVARTRGFVRPVTALEKIFTSAVTIGTGGSAGTEGPIVQIGAALSSAVGSVFRIARHQMPVLIGCGCAAGISAIFNAPIGGLLFTLEVILRDFSMRTVAPIIVASVVANVTMRAILARVHEAEAAYITVFADPEIRFDRLLPGDALLSWGEMGNFVLLGLACGLVGVLLMKAMQGGEWTFRRLVTGPAWVRAMRPAVGGAMLGLLGVAAVLSVGEAVTGRDGHFGDVRYPMPAFFGDGYGVIEAILTGGLLQDFPAATLVGILLGLCLLKVVATTLTLTSGGSGGVIAPSLFLGATAGGALGLALRESGLFVDVRPEAYALIGMAAVLAAVIHAPLASILILFEITGENRVLLPGMLAVVVALGTSRLIARDSLYTAALRRRGVDLAAGDPERLRRISIEQVALEPATVVQVDETLEKVVPLLERVGNRDIVVLDEEGRYAGLLGAGEVGGLLISGELPAAATVGDLMRTDVPLLAHTDDLQKVFEQFARLEMAALPVGLAHREGKVIGLITRAALLARLRAEG